MILTVIAAGLSVALIGAPVSSTTASDSLSADAKAAVISAAEVANIYLLEELRIQKEITGIQGKHAQKNGLPKSENTRLAVNLGKQIKQGYAEQKALSSALKAKDYTALLELLGNDISWNKQNYNAKTCSAATAYDDRKARHDSVRQRVVAKAKTSEILSSVSDAKAAIRQVDDVRNAASLKVRKSGEQAVANVLAACGFKL